MNLDIVIVALVALYVKIGHWEILKELLRLTWLLDGPMGVTNERHVTETSIFLLLKQAIFQSFDEVK